MIKNISISDADRNELGKLKIDPSTQADDHFDYSKVVVKKPWGYEYMMYQNDISAVWILYIKQGCQTSRHCHPGKKTSLVVLSGEALCSSLREKIKRTAGEGLLIDKGVFHCTESMSENGIFVMEIETPNNKRDLVRLEDKYGRVGMGYESVSEMSFNLQNYNYITFIEPHIYYNVKRKFGTCSLAIAKFSDYAGFKETFQRQGWDAVNILKGGIVDQRRNVVLEAGDTIDVESIRSHPEVRIQDEIEVIIIKRRDSMVKLSDYVVSFLEKENVKDVFIVPGSPNVHLLDSVGRNTNLRHICTQTEQAAAMAAEGCAKLTGGPAVAILSSGASGTNALTGVADAWVDSTPLVIISGQARSDETSNGSLRQLGIQELDIVSIVRPITKYAVKIEDANSIKVHLEKAFFLAKDGRPGPVWIDIPIDIQGMNIDEEDLRSFDPAEIRASTVRPDISKQVAETLDMLQHAKRPVLLAGNGIRLAVAEEDFIKLVRLLSIPVLTSRRGADLLPDDHPMYFGRPGAYGQRSANFIIQNSDVLLSIGSRLSLPQIGRNYKAFARGAKRIVVDVDPEELAKSTVQPHLAIHSSAREFIRKMLDRLTEQNAKSDWIRTCEDWKSKYSSPAAGSGGGPVNAYFFMQTLARVLPEGARITIDGGAPLIFFMQAFKFKSGQRFISATGLENTGFALPAAVGACIGNSGRDVICICEDRGFQKNVSELETLLQYKLPVKLFILNTGGYSYIRETQREYFGGRYVASDPEDGVISADLSHIGEAYKIRTFTVRTDTELVEIIPKIVQMKGPVICDLAIDKNQKIAPKIAFTVKPDGKWVSKPLEDMYPFMDRDEFKRNMIVDILEEE